MSNSLKAELGPPPVTSLGVVADGVVSLEPDPVRNRTVLLSLLGQDLLNLEGLLGGHLSVTLYVPQLYRDTALPEDLQD
eukprot:CAMPEP_0113879140 /NCGR_PEP_ID=MMETSP0780_2-20120614/7070_1 /TAXON_ID=652834 /ORGANISM="Palpitomonas bilix" /LENGTH=78 /DNA_ID=CAMNT_0000865683 /DNA_START=519 /DNA_END=755 /DNA_ORIENTATION=- /assembly_acc=CAM_ASM_000599